MLFVYFDINQLICSLFLQDFGKLFCFLSSNTFALCCVGYTSSSLRFEYTTKKSNKAYRMYSGILKLLPFSICEPLLPTNTDYVCTKPEQINSFLKRASF
ncbi:Protein of unknown function [Gryllus bimaculatus]|nr:Protein of unknown function [Gryllus bimaculatus]